MRRLWWKFWARVFSMRLARYYEWGMYESGFAGHGPSVLDVQPSEPKPWLPGFLRRQADREIADIAAFKRDARRSACMDVLGEDPDKWAA